MRAHLKLDYDDCVPMAEWKMRSLLERAGYEIVAVKTRHSPSGGGWHVLIELAPEPESPAVTVALQSILGSDPYREAYNIGRIRHLDKVPGFWQRRWNVLYKITGTVRRANNRR